MVDDRQEHDVRSALVTVGTFSLGYNLGNNYLRSHNLNNRQKAALGAAFSLVPAFLNEKQDFSTTLLTTATMALFALKGKQIKKIAVDNAELFEGLFINLKKFNENQNAIKEFFIESNQKILYERDKNKGFVEGLISSISKIGKEVFDHFDKGTAISKSKAYYKYESLRKGTDYLSFEEFNKLGKKIPFEYLDYINKRRQLDKEIAGVKTGSNILTTLGFFSRVSKEGKLEVNPLKFLETNANNIKAKIDILDEMPDLYGVNSFDSEELLNKYLKDKNMGFFREALDNGVKTDSRQVSYREFMKEHSKKLFLLMGAKENKYFDKDGNVKYLDILGDQVFSDNLAYSKKGKMWDTTWLKPTNYALDLVKIIDNSMRPFFRSLPLGENRQFPIFDTLNLDTKVYNSIYGNPMDNLYVDQGNNIDLLKTNALLTRQINRMRAISNKDWRTKNGYKTISQALFKSNEFDFVYNPNIKDEDTLRRAIKLLENKQASIEEMINKTGGVLKKSSLIGYEDDMDKAFNKYFVKVKDVKKSRFSNATEKELKLVETTENKINAVFFNNKMYLKNNDTFQEQSGQYVLDLSKQTRIIQAKRSGEYYTTKANSVGRYVEKETAPYSFEFEDFKTVYETQGFKEAYKYAYDSDLNSIPILGRNGYNDSDNTWENIKEPFQRVKQYIETTDKSKQEKLSMASLFLGIQKQHTNFYSKYNEEVRDAFDKLIVKYDKGMKEISDLISDNHDLMRKYKVISGNNTRTLTSMNITPMSSKSIRNILDGQNITEDISNALQIHRAFEMSSDKYKISKEYRSIKEIGTIADKKAKKRLGDLFNPDNFKEDIIINTFNQGEDYKEFTDKFGDLFNGNIMFQKESLFNKNRILNVSVKKPSIVKRAFTGFDFSDVESFGESFSDMLTGSNKLGTNLGMFITKGLESYENSLTALGIPKLNPDNISSTAEYATSVFAKRILPFYAAAEVYGIANSFVDMVLPDNVPIFGKGLTSAMFKGISAIRMGIQIAINGIGLGALSRKIEEMFPGMLTDNGLLSPLQLSYTNEEMYAVLFDGKEVEDRKNRFWYSSGRQSFSGGEVQNIRPHLLYLGQQRTSGIYENKVQRFFRQDFLPTKLLWTMVDPYMEERINAEKRPVVKSADLFNSEIPIIGGVFNMLGKIIKPTKYFREEEWKVSNGVMINPEYDGQENTPEVLYYDTSWTSTKAMNKAFEDIKSIMGMRGYMLGQAVNLYFGDDSLNDKVALETLNDGQSMLEKYNQLNLGGMFGITEPIRRLLGNQPIEKNISPLRNTNLPDWMPQNYFKNVSFGNVYEEIPFGEFILPGEVYEQYNTLHSDETGKYGVADRLKILSKVAPFSKEFRHTRQQALKKLDVMSQEERQMVYQALSYAEKWREKNVEKNQRIEVDTSDLEVTVKRLEGPFEFYGTDNKRYKLAGIGTDFFNGRSSEDMLAQLDTLRASLQRGTILKGIVATDPLTSVKTDNAGEYIELYVPKFDKFDKLKQESYLRYSYESDYDITDSMMYAFKNAKKPASLEKIWGDKDVYARYYYENILDPEFKNWEAPIESFVNPILDTASTGFKGYMSAMNTSIRLGEFGDPVMPVLTTMSYLKGMVLGPNIVNRVERENYLKNMTEYAKSQLDIDDYKGNFNSSIYNMSESDGLSKMKNYLTNAERKYLDYIVNENDEEKRQKMYEVSSDRMKMVLNELWKRQAEYGGGTYAGEDINLPTYEDESLAVYNATNESSFSDALFKYEMGFDLTTYEEQTLSLFGTEHLKEYKRKKNMAEYIDRIMGRGNNQKVLSTTMTQDNYVFGY